MDYLISNPWLAITDVRYALVVGHPGHELLVHGWLEVARPLVFVLTDGSGRSKQSRLASTTTILKQTGAKPGPIYGRLTDAAAYAAIINHQFDLFLGLTQELCEALVAERIDFVAGDAYERYNPLHDVCRLIVNAAVRLASKAKGYRVGNFEFSLANRPGCTTEVPPGGIEVTLDETALARKLTAAKGYAPLAGEVFAALEKTTADAFRVECLCPADLNAGHNHNDGIPFYETYGEQQVAAGYYNQVLRYHEHIRPLAEALARLVQST
jgi:hypothetical protein